MTPQREKIIADVDVIRQGMNTSRLYKDNIKKDVKITKYWLLGFTEGDGSFGVTSRDFSTTFSLTQLSRDKYLFEKIIEYLNSYNENLYIKETSMGIYLNTKENIDNQNFAKIKWILFGFLVLNCIDFTWKNKTS